VAHLDILSPQPPTCAALAEERDANHLVGIENQPLTEGPSEFAWAASSVAFAEWGTIVTSLLPNIFDVENIRAVSTEERANAVRAELRKQYLADDRPWVVAYSGGKDSTLVLQLVIEMLLELAIGNVSKPIYVISSDTRVEAPQVVEYVEKVLAAVTSFAQQHNLPIRSELVRPTVEQGFWAKLIGLGHRLIKPHPDSG